MILSKEQYNKLPNEYKKYFAKEVGGMGEYRKNIHPTLLSLLNLCNT